MIWIPAFAGMTKRENYRYDGYTDGTGTERTDDDRGGVIIMTEGMLTVREEVDLYI